MLKLASYNIQFGRGKDWRYDLARIAGEVRGADIIALQEVETFAERSGMVDQADALAELLAPMHWVYGPGIDIAVPGETGRRRRFGNMVLSRWPILSATNHTLPKIATADQFSLRRTALEAVIDAEGYPLRFFSVHLDHTAPATRLPQIRALMDIIRDFDIEGPSISGLSPEGWGLALPPSPRDAIVMGDLNFAPATAEYDLMIGEPGGRYGRLVREAGLADAWVAAGHGEADGVTIGLDGNGTQRRIDHCFLSTRLRPAVRAMRIDTAAQGSDHQPIFVDLDLEPVRP